MKNFLDFIKAVGRDINALRRDVNFLLFEDGENGVEISIPQLRNQLNVQLTKQETKFNRKIESLTRELENAKKEASSQSPKPYGPTGYTIVFEGDDYIIQFDNGARLVIGFVNAKKNIGQIRGLTGIGKPHPFDGKSTSLAPDPLPYSIMRTSTRNVQIATWEASNGIANWYREGVRVENPVRDKNDYDFSNAYYNKNDTNATSLANQPRLIETYYQLGLFSDDELKRFGAVKK